MDGVSDCVNESIRVSSKGICKLYHFWLVKFKLRLYLKKEGLLELVDEECASIFKLKLTIILIPERERAWKSLSTWGEVEGAWALEKLEGAWVLERAWSLDHLRI